MQNTNGSLNGRTEDQEKGKDENTLSNHGWSGSVGEGVDLGNFCGDRN